MSSESNIKAKKSAKWVGLRMEQTIDSLISAPLVAASKANAMMLTGQARFLIENCFTKQGDGSYRPVLIRMALSSNSVVPDKAKEKGFEVVNHTLYFQVPLISLLPLNNLVVDSMKVDFGMDITSVRKGKTRTDWKKEGKIPGVLKHTAVISGRISQEDKSGKKQHQNTSGAHLNVRIAVKAQALPKGTQALLDLYSGMISPVSPSADKDTSSEEKE